MVYMSVPTGRFAPSPTGHLHFGSLLTAVASYCHIKSLQGNWLIRIEDTDLQRCSQTNADDIIKTLALFGLHSDSDIRYQHKHVATYQAILNELIAKNHAYYCDCSRKSIKVFLENQPHLPQHIYPNICRNTNKKLTTSTSIRLKTHDNEVCFTDMVQQVKTYNPSKTVGDMVLCRHDGTVNYILTSIVDDIEQNITHVVRGLDLIELTSCQLAIKNILCPEKHITYGHLPLAFNKQGQKLSKQTKAKSIVCHTEQQISHLLNDVLVALHQLPVTLDKPSHMLAEAIHNWTLEPIKNQIKISGDYE